MTSTDPGPGRLARISVTLALVGSRHGCYKEPVAITTYIPSDLPAAGDPSEST